MPYRQDDDRDGVFGIKPSPLRRKRAISRMFELV